MFVCKFGITFYDIILYCSYLMFLFLSNQDNLVTVIVKYEYSSKIHWNVDVKNIFETIYY